MEESLQAPGVVDASICDVLFDLNILQNAPLFLEEHALVLMVCEMVPFIPGDEVLV